MAQTNQPMGSSPLAAQGQVMRSMPPGANLAQLGGALGNYGAIPNAQTSTGMQTPPNMQSMWQQLTGAGGGPQKALGAFQGMRPQPPSGAPGQGPGGGKAGNPGQMQNMKQQIAGLQGAPPRGAPGQGPGGAKGAGQKQQIAQLQRAPGHQMMMR